MIRWMREGWGPAWVGWAGEASGGGLVRRGGGGGGREGCRRLGTGKDLGVFETRGGTSLGQVGVQGFPGGFSGWSGGAQAFGHF